MNRKIFPALLSQSERRALAKLSAKSRCSQSATIRCLIHDAPLAKMCRDLIAQLLRDKTFRHRALLLAEVRRFVKAHGGVPKLERLLREHGQ
ncbi:MAG: hypothetical protein KF747_03510 [Nitrospira sp.]|nr:hypothetical protein [Nitrospira sp.]